MLHYSAVAKKPKANPNKIDNLASSNDSWQNAEDKNARDKEMVILKATAEPRPPHCRMLTINMLVAKLKEIIGIQKCYY